MSLKGLIDSIRLLFPLVAIWTVEKVEINRTNNFENGIRDGWNASKIHLPSMKWDFKTTDLMLESCNIYKIANVKYLSIVQFF